MVDVDALICHKRGVARSNAVGPLGCSHATAGDGLECFYRTRDDAALLRARHDRLGERMLTAALEGGGEFEEPLLGYGGGAVRTLCGKDVGYDGLAPRDGAGLVEHHRFHATQRLEGLGAFEQDAHLGTLAGAHHDGDGRGESQRTGAADYHYGDCRGECLIDVSAGGDEPYREGGCGDDEHCRHEDGGDLVCQARDGGLRGVGFLDEADDAGEVRIGSDARCAEGQGSRAIDCGGAHGVAGCLFRRDGLAREGALVYGGRALENHAVHGDGFTRTH